MLGWTVEQEVYESVMSSQENEKYLPGYKIPGMDCTMEITDVTESCEILVLALPTSDSGSSRLAHPKPQTVPSHVDLAKGLPHPPKGARE